MSSPRWLVIASWAYAAASVAAIVALHAREPAWIALHAAAAVTGLVAALRPRAWLAAGVVAVVATGWGAWWWARLGTTWLGLGGPLAIPPAARDAVLREAGELTAVTLWLNIVAMVAWARARGGRGS